MEEQTYREKRKGHEYCGTHESQERLGHTHARAFTRRIMNHLCSNSLESPCPETSSAAFSENGLDSSCNFDVSVGGGERSIFLLLPP